MEKVYNFKYVDEEELLKAAQAVVDAALICQEVNNSNALVEMDKDTLVDAVFEDPSLMSCLFQAGRPIELD